MESPPGSGYLEAPPGALSQIEGNPPLEVLIRSRGYFAFMEPVEIELRLRNLLPDIPLTVDAQLDPAFGGVIIFLKRPDGRIMEYEPIMCKLATPQLRTLQPVSNGVTGTDRYSESIFLSYGRYGFYFDAPGDYLIRALYQGPGNILVPSNMHRIRVGHPTSKAEDQLAQNFFTYPVGMSLYLGGSQSPHLEKGMNTLQEVAERFTDSLLGAKAASVVAESVARPFFRIQDEGGQRALRQTHQPQPEEALAITEPVLSVYRSAEGQEASALNLSYHRLVRNRSKLLAQVNQEQRAREELASLREDLDNRGVNQPVLEEIQAYEQSLTPQRTGRPRKKRR
jgi:hypothetical protein